MRRTVFLYGATCLIGQLLAVRELSVAFHGNELLYGVLIAGWLILFALGSGLVGLLAERFRLGVGTLCMTLAGGGLLVPLTILFARTALPGIAGAQNVAPSLGVAAGTTLLVMAPLCLALGFFYALACAIAARQEPTSATGASRVYVFEAIGSFAGGALFTSLLIHLATAFAIAWEYPL